VVRGRARGAGTEGGQDLLQVLHRGFKVVDPLITDFFPSKKQKKE
jgi:hypothetical protein